MAGYSSTPLIKKLGIREDARTTFINAPENFAATLGPLPDGATLLRRARHPMDFVLMFTTAAAELATRFKRLAATLAPAGMLWIAWPKKSSGVVTDITFEVVQRVGLDAGLVDVKICAIDDVWSGLKFVRRMKDRM